jgi:hypothetical protein
MPEKNKNVTPLSPENPDQNGNFQDKQGSGDTQDNQDKSSTDENIKALQQKLSQKDKELKEAQTKITNFEKKNLSEMEKLQTQLNENSKIIKDFQLSQKRQNLSKKYPDILPDLLMNLEDTEIEKIVSSQRELAKTKYGDSSFFQLPEYSSIEDINKAMENV